MTKSNSHENKLEWAKSIVIALGIVFIVRTFLFSPVTVDGASMEPTLHNRERIIVSKAISWIGEPDRGDIVIFKGKDPKTNYVKRVIALPGDVIEMRNDELFINEELVKEPYLEENKKDAEKRSSKLTEDFGPLIVPANQYFVMGDNRFRSNDSRSELGLIDADRMIGKSKFVIFPVQNVRSTE